MLSVLKSNRPQTLMGRKFVAFGLRPVKDEATGELIRYVEGSQAGGGAVPTADHGRPANESRSSRAPSAAAKHCLVSASPSVHPPPHLIHPSLGTHALTSRPTATTRPISTSCRAFGNDHQPLSSSPPCHIRTPHMHDCQAHISRTDITPSFLSSPRNIRAIAVPLSSPPTADSRAALSIYKSNQRPPCVC